MNGWVTPDERLPRLGQRVIVRRLRHDGVVIEQSATYDQRSGSPAFFFGPAHCVLSEKVVIWMAAENEEPVASAPRKPSWSEERRRTQSERMRQRWAEGKMGKRKSNSTEGEAP